MINASGLQQTPIRRAGEPIDRAPSERAVSAVIPTGPEPKRTRAHPSDENQTPTRIHDRVLQPDVQPPAAEELCGPQRLPQLHLS